MGQDTPDWGGKYVNTQFYPLDDLGELAARLWSPVTYDRRGAVIWMTDFRFGIGDVGPAATGTGSTVALSASVYEAPPFSCVLQSGTASGASASIERRMAVPVSKRVGFAASYRFGANVSQLNHDLWYYDGAALNYSYLLLDCDADVLQVRTAESGLVTLLSPLPDLRTGYYFSHVKLVADLSTMALVRAVFDDHEYDLAGYTMATTPSTDAPNLRCRIFNQGYSGSAATVNADNLIITANEP
jgi:hypothetical protein